MAKKRNGTLCVCAAHRGEQAGEGAPPGQHRVHAVVQSLLRQPLPRPQRLRPRRPPQPVQDRGCQGQLSARFPPLLRSSPFMMHTGTASELEELVWVCCLVMPEREWALRSSAQLKASYDLRVSLEAHTATHIQSFPCETHSSSTARISCAAGLEEGAFSAQASAQQWALLWHHHPKVLCHTTDLPPAWHMVAVGEA